MKKSHQISLSLIVIGIAIAMNGCTKDSATTTDSLYVPSSSDVTANATLAELQQGRSLYISNCGGCHSLYLPESFSVTRWKSILPSMTPRTSLTSAEIQLVTKYVCKGKQ